MSSTNSALWSVTALGDCALQVRAERGISQVISERIHRLARQIRDLGFPEMLAVVPAFDTLTLRFVAGCDLLAARSRIVELCSNFSSHAPVLSTPASCVEVLVGAEFGPDLAALATQLSCSPEAALMGFCSREYLVAQIGFQPGFPYLLGLPDAFAMPRRSEPRASVRPGSIAIGGAQAGIYPGASPGGWNVIAYTKQILFDPNAEAPCLFTAGNRVRFVWNHGLQREVLQASADAYAG